MNNEDYQQELLELESKGRKFYRVVDGFIAAELLHQARKERDEALKKLEELETLFVELHPNGIIIEKVGIAIANPRPTKEKSNA